MNASADDTGTNPEAELLKALIRCRSVTPDDAGCLEILVDVLESLGFACERLPFDDVSNLWARRGSDGPLLCFAGHTDVVPPGNIDDWDSDPFEPDVRDGLLYGRGAADMKGSLAAMMTAMERFVASHPDHAGSIAFLITSDEEGKAVNGTRRVVETLTVRKESIDWCVVGEPSSHRVLGDAVRIGRRGSLTGRLRVRGQQGHVAYPHLASNPIRSFAPVLAQLNDVDWDEGNEHFPPTSFEVVNLASGLGVHNVIPGDLTAEFNFRFSTEWNHQKLTDSVHNIFDQHDIDYEIEWHESGDPFLTEPGQLTDAVAGSILDIAGLETEFSTAGGTSDGRFIAPTGADVVELGPVNASIHKINEHVSVDDLQKLSLIYERIAERLLTNQTSNKS